MDLTAALADALKVVHQVLAVPDVDFYIGLMHTLFTLEDSNDLHVEEIASETDLRVDVGKSCTRCSVLGS